MSGMEELQSLPSLTGKKKQHLEPLLSLSKPKSFLLKKINIRHSENL